MTRVLVCGGRDFSARDWLYDVLDRLSPQSAWIIAGDANGADRLAFEWAFDRRVNYQGYPARWDLHGRKAGPLRNQQMIDEGKPDLVVAFPGGRGTADMVRRAEKAGLTVIRVRP